MKNKLFISIVLWIIIMFFVSCVKNTNLEQNENHSLRYSIDGIKLAKDYDKKELSDSFESVKFGKYEQDNDLDNGKEDIEWIVLDKSDNKLLLLSKYILDNVPYNEKNGFVVWNDSTLRNWLNTNFYDLAFNAEEKKSILRNNYNNHSISFRSFDVKAEPKIELKTSDDLVSLIGYYDIVKYLGKLYDNIDTPVMNRRIVAKSTPYAQRKVGTYKIGLTVEKANLWNKGCSPYWLRTTFLMNDTYDFIDADMACIVDTRAEISYTMYDDSHAGVRPMILLDLTKISTDKLNIMLSYNPNDSLFASKDEIKNNDKLNDSNQVSDNWEMKFYTECIDMFRSKFDSALEDFGTYEYYKPTYISETDGSIIFTYGLRDLDDDGIKEFLVFNKSNLFTVYTLNNDWVEDYEKYNETFYPIELVSILPLYSKKNEECTSFLSENNLVVYNAVLTEITDLSSDDYYNSLSEDKKKDLYQALNYTSFLYNLMQITKNDGCIIKESFSYETNSEDNLGEYSYILNGDYVDKRISKPEADAIFSAYGKPVVLNESLFVIR